MKRFLKRVEDGSYFLEPGTWTEDISQAHCFIDSPAAIRCCIEHHLPPVQLILDSQDPPVHLSLPLFINHVTEQEEPKLCAGRMKERLKRAVTSSGDMLLRLQPQARRA